jgi:protein-S-isoprenylcysteine O-methyltransferase Ste14
MGSRDWLATVIIVVYSGLSAIKIHYELRARRLGEPTVIRESRPYAALLAAFICYEVGTLALYLFAPRWIAWANLSLRPWVRWVGAAVCLLTLPWFAWVHHVLGHNFSTTLNIRANHTLVTTGPYRWIRHPMYTAFYALHLATILATANLFLGLTWLAGLIVVITLRVEREEAMMVRQFGEAYRAYMAQTGRFLPLLPRRVRNREMA